MNNHEYIIGRMLNDEDVRMQYCEYIDECFFKCELTKQILRCLKEKDFTFEELLTKYGRKVVCHAMYLANKTRKIESMKDGKECS